MVEVQFRLEERPDIGGDAHRQHPYRQQRDPARPPCQYRPAEPRQSHDQAEQRRPPFGDRHITQSSHHHTKHCAISPTAVAVSPDPTQQERQQKRQIVFLQLREWIEGSAGPFEPVVRQQQV